MGIEKVQAGDPISAKHTNKMVESLRELLDMTVDGGIVSRVGGFYIDILSGDYSPSNVVIGTANESKWTSDDIVKPYSVMQLGSRKASDDTDADISDSDTNFDSMMVGAPSAGVPSIACTADWGFLGSDMPCIYSGLALVAYDPSTVPARSDGDSTVDHLRTGDHLGSPSVSDPSSDDLKAVWDRNGSMTVMQTFQKDSGVPIEKNLLDAAEWDSETTRLAVVYLDKEPRSDYIIITDGEEFFEVCHTLILGDGVEISAEGKGWIEIDRS